LADSVARLVSAATVEARLAVELALGLEVPLALAGVAAAWLLLMLSIDILLRSRLLESMVSADGGRI
jgi:hypothetical protein